MHPARAKKIRHNKRLAGWVDRPGLDSRAGWGTKAKPKNASSQDGRSVLVPSEGPRRLRGPVRCCKVRRVTAAQH